jgi:hypothetical protein
MYGGSGESPHQASGCSPGLILLDGLIWTDFLSDQGIWLRDWQPWYTYRLFGMEAGFFAFAKASFPWLRQLQRFRVEEIISDSEKETRSER